MTETERKALALFNEVAREHGWDQTKEIYAEGYTRNEALFRAIEQHEAFRQEVSDAVDRAIDDCGHDGMRKAHISSRLDRFIIAKPDPLVETFRAEFGWMPAVAKDVGAAITKHGGKIVWEDGE